MRKRKCKLISKSKHWLSWFIYFKKLKHYTELINSIIGFVNGKVSLYQRTKRIGKLVGLADKKGKENQSSETSGKTPKKTAEIVSKDLSATLERFQSDLDSYLKFLNNFFIDLKQKYNMTSFDEQELFNSLYLSQAIPYSVKQEMTLVMRQLDALFPTIESDFEFILRTVLSSYN